MVGNRIFLGSSFGGLAVMSIPRPGNLLVAAATRYYVEGLSQQEVANQLCTSRSNVSKMLRAARDTGIVEIRIHGGSTHDKMLEQALCERFGLQGAAVPSLEPSSTSRPTDPPDALGLTARLAGEIVLDAATTVDRIAISWGTTLRAVIETLPQLGEASADIGQLVGGFVSLKPRATAHDLVQELGRRLNAHYRYLNSPAIFESAEALEHLLCEKSVRATLDFARHADFALVGIGDPRFGSSATLLRLLNLDQEVQDLFWSDEPAGEICGRYYNCQGELLSYPLLDERILAVNAEDLRAITTVVGVAVGDEKVHAVLGALRAGLIDVLVCDPAVAENVLDLDAQTSTQATRLQP
jgi:DNA-binding transcriptional regulator LsrR (DeoR family)